MSGGAPWTAPQELRDLAARYARAVDSRDADGLAEIFTTDGVMGGWRSDEVRYAGAEGCRQMIDQVEASFARTMHNVFNQTFEQAEDGAVSGLTHGVASHILPGDGSDLVDFAMRYHDLYAQESGRWKFRERRMEVVWIEQRKVTRPTAEAMSRVLKGF